MPVPRENDQAVPRGLVLSFFLLILLGIWGWRVVHPPVDRHATVPSAVFLVDINRADAATLELLPGIGPSIAESIVAYRESAGPIVAPQQLESVRMIGPVLRRRMTPWIYWAEPAQPSLTPETTTPPDAASAAPR